VVFGEVVFAFVKYLKFFRNQAGLTQVALSERSGVALRTIQNIEAGKAEPSMPIALKLSQALKVGLDDLVLGPREAATA
jgi:transcriptional regulator with XRE-family HTH domain